VSSGEVPEFTEAMLANILLGIGTSDEFSDIDGLHEELADLLGELLKSMVGEEEEGDKEDGEEAEEEMARPSHPAGSTRIHSSLAKPPSSVKPPSVVSPSVPSSLAKPPSSPVSTPAKPAMLAIMPAAPEPEKKANNGVTSVPYCAYPVNKLDIGKKEIEVATTGNVNLQVAAGFTLKANDIIRLPLTGDSKVYTLARLDASAPFKNMGTTIDKVTASTIKLPNGVAANGLYIITTGKQKECEAGDIRISKSIKFESSGGIGNTFRLITDNTDDLPKKIPTSVSSPVSVIPGPPNNNTLKPLFSISTMPIMTSLANRLKAKAAATLVGASN
jgi:hypothetical protein